MKNIRRVLTIMFVLFCISCFFAVFAAEEYVLKKEIVYTKLESEKEKDAYVEIMVGQKNFTQYQKDGNIVITPAPDEMREDKFGNLYAYYDLSDYNKDRTLKVTIKRYFESETYSEEISVRSESTTNSENGIFVQEQERVDSKDARIIAKAKELTEGLSSDYKRAMAIFEYVNTELKYDTSSSYANKGSISAIVNGKGVCEEFATLYGALCRAVDIPCRLVEGYRFEKKVVKESEIIFDNSIGEYVYSEPVHEYELINHVWNDIYLDDYGWVPVDTCVRYASNKDKVAYLGAFCSIEVEEYIANGIYNYAKGNRIMSVGTVKEESFSETMYLASEEQTEEHVFLDMNGYEWAEESINTLYDMEIIKGYSDTVYGPEGNVSRIEFITMLARALKHLNYQPSKTSGMIYYFMDYDKDHYSKQEYDYLMRLLEDESPYDKFAMGYLAMTEIFGNSIQMNKPITRGEVVALLDAFLEYESNEFMDFTDVYGNRFIESILKAYSNGLINGYPDGTFRPNGTITRAEIAVILDRYVGVKDYVL